MLDKKKLANDDPALLYKMLLEERAKAEVECVSQAAQDFLNAIRETLDQHIDIYQKEYGVHWQEVMENDWKSLYYEILEKKEDLLLEYFRSII